jgi:hypothetical protein
MTMSVRDVEAIDYVGMNILFSKVYIGIFDELDWTDEAHHRDVLTRKIDRCIRYIRSGQLLTNYPKVRGYDIVIEYVSNHPMTRSAMEFWRTREHLIRLAGFDVRTRGVDVRHSLGIEVEHPVEPEPATVELTEPAPLHIDDAGIEVLDADPFANLPDVSRVSYLPSMSSKLRNRKQSPVLSRLAIRRAAAY